MSAHSRLVALLLALVVVGVCLFGLVAAGADRGRESVHCAEDDPCWDCSTMGNRICGPVAP